MSTNDPPGLDPDGGDDTTERDASDTHSVSNPTSPRSQVAEMDDLDERFSQQQVMISQLKEMVIAEEAARNQKIASSRLKMEKCVSQLARIRDRAKGSRMKKDSSETPESSMRSTPSMSVEPDNSSRSSVVSVSSEFLPLTSSSVAALTTATLTTTTTPITISDSAAKSKTPRRDVTKMLHQQIQGHKEKIAKTAKHEKELEEALAKIQKQLVENQSKTAEMLQLGQAKPKVSLPAHLLLDDNSESNKIITELKIRITQLEGTVLDLQETCKEKDSVIDAKTKAITLMSADLSKKGKNTLDLLDDTKEQMQQMQQNFATMESQMKDEKQKLSDELETSKNRIFYLEEANAILETERFNLSIQNSLLEEQLEEKEKEINRMKEEMLENMKNMEELTIKVDKAIETDASYEEKGSIEISQMNALSEKIEILEKLNASLRQSNIELQERISPSTATTAKDPVKQTKEESPKLSKKGKTPAKSKGSQKYKNLNPKTEPSKETVPEKDSNKDMQETIDRLQVVIEVMNKQILEKEILLSQKEMESSELKETSLDTSMEEVVEIPSNDSPLSKSEVSDVPFDHKKQDTEPTTECDLEDAKTNSIEAQLEDAIKEIDKLTSQLVDANKNMIKVKAAHKKEIKQMQKSIDDFSKVSDTNTEVVKLQSDVSLLTQKIAELEDEKGNLQLHLVDYDSGRVSDSQLHAKLLEMENLAEERLKAIAELETQKFDLVQELHSLKQQMSELEDKVADLTYLENEHVSTELKLARLEEQLDIAENKYKEVLNEIELIKSEKEGLHEIIEASNKEKVELNNKLEMYIQENMELIEKLDKLSAEKVSSAESIEMVESLTSQEKLEIEQYQKSIEDGSMDKKKSRAEVEESLRRSSFSHSTHLEGGDLPSSIDIINQERHEFMEKLDNLKIENNGLSLKLEQLLNEKKALEDRLESLEGDASNFALVLNDEKSNSSNLAIEINNLKQQNTDLSELVKTLTAGREARTEEVVVSETVEIEHISEKEIIQPVSSSQVAVENKEPASKNTKNNKNLTKEILRLKNLVKQQEADIESLNAQLTQTKEETSTQNIPTSEPQTLSNDIERALEENKILNEEVLKLKNIVHSSSHQMIEIENLNKQLFSEKSDLSDLIVEKDDLIEDLESKLSSSDGVLLGLRARVDQHKSDLDMLNSIMQSKDDEIAQYKHDIEQLDAVSRKLKSTLSQIEEDKSTSSSNVHKIKELESSLDRSKEVIEENETKIKELENKMKESLESIDGLKAEIESSKLTVADLSNEKSAILKEISNWKEGCSAKDEEINEIKLQLRKESIAHDEAIDILKNMEENHKAHSEKITQLEASCEEYKSKYTTQKEEHDALDKKSKEQFDKMKKIAINFKKKSALCTELETQVESLKNEVQKYATQLEESNMKYNQVRQELSIVNSQYGVAQSQLQQSSSTNETKEVLERQVNALQNQIYEMESQIKQYEIQIQSQNADNVQLSDNVSALTSNVSEAEFKLNVLSEENESLSNRIHTLGKDLEMKSEELLKLNNLEEELKEKHFTITNLTELIEETKSLYNQFKCGQEAKLQEKDIYIESLEGEIMKHKDRVLRLEDSVSTMEERRASLERKTDHLVTKLNEKDAKCSESSFHEDELEKRLVALIEHDEFIQKQLTDTQQENSDLSEKLSSLSDSNTIVRSELEAARVELNSLKNDLSRLQVLEEERHGLNERILYLESELKRINSESTEIIKQKSKEYEYLESELHSFMSNTENQRRLSREQFDKLQDEMSAQSQILKDLQQENEWLKVENETITFQKAQLEEPQENTAHVDFVKFDEKVSSSDLESKIRELNNLLDAKEQQINALSIQLQLAQSNTPEVLPSDSNKVGELESILEKKNEEIAHIDSQFKSCLNQLTDTIESEKSLKQTVADLSKEINCQIGIVKRLEDEIAQLNATKEQYASIKPVIESICQSNIVQAVASKKAEPMHKDSSLPSGDIDPKGLKALEDQIITGDIQDSFAMSDAEKKMIRNFQHDPPEPVSVSLRSYFQSGGSAEEELIQPKKAFLCYKGEGDQPLTENPFDEDDGWGWGNQETVVEDQQLQSSENNAMKINELESLIQTLTSEKNMIAADLAQSQQKTTKALLKLKEFKNKNEALTNEVKKLKLSSDFNMLDMTIQDELASQIKTLEDKIKEMFSDASKEKLEKDNLLKRIDVLTAANDRLTEMKEKQDIEMQICKNQNKGLNEKIKNLDWDNSFADNDNQPISTQEEEIDTVSEPQDVSNVKDIIELIKKIQDLEADNEELQAFVEDQQKKMNQYKSIEIELEKLKTQSGYEIDELKVESESLKQKLTDMGTKCDEFESIIKKLNEDLINKADSSVQNDNFLCEISKLQEKISALTVELESKNSISIELDDAKNTNINLQARFDELTLSYNALAAEADKLRGQSESQIRELTSENENLKDTIKSNVAECDLLKNNFKTLTDENANLKNELQAMSEKNLQHSEIEIIDLRGKLEALVKEYYEFQEKFNDMASEKDRIEFEYNILIVEKDKLDMIYKDVSEQEAACKTELIKLSYEKDELTEKYDKLLNKISEKNISEETEHTIIFTDKLNNLTQELNEKNSDIIQLKKRIEEFEEEKLQLQSNANSLREDNVQLANNLAELRNFVEEAVNQRGIEVAAVWKQHVEMREMEFLNVEQALQQELALLQVQKSSENVQTSESSKVEESFTSRIELEKLKEQLEETTKSLIEIKQQMEYVVLEKDNFKELYETQTAVYQDRCEQIQREFEHEKSQNFENSDKVLHLTTELENLKVLYNNSQTSNDETLKKEDHYSVLIAAKEKELQDSLTRIHQVNEKYNIKINDYELALTNKETELDNVRQQLYVAENKLSDNVHEHEAELADMRLRLHAERTQYDQIVSELKDKAEKLEMQLETKINECKSLNMKIESMIEGENARLNELKKALESQEIEIVTLKENLIEQTETYEKLVISHLQEIHKLKSNRHVSFSEETKPGAEITEPASSDTKDTNPAVAELDLALYMLHQRDVRCEELTMELTQLLEERDTLQLKLSNALRFNEELRFKASPSEIENLQSGQAIEETVLSSAAQQLMVEGKSSTVGEVHSKTTDSSPGGSKSLESKISQLHKMGHMRDIRLRDEREHRMRQMELLQKDLQHLPPEAAARLREAHYTLTRDTQSASTVLLNWLWGKTTPKVVHM